MLAYPESVLINYLERYVGRDLRIEGWKTNQRLCLIGSPLLRDSTFSSISLVHIINHQ